MATQTEGRLTDLQFCCVANVVTASEAREQFGNCLKRPRGLKACYWLADLYANQPLLSARDGVEPLT